MTTSVTVVSLEKPATAEPAKARGAKNLNCILIVCKISEGLEQLDVCCEKKGGKKGKGRQNREEADADGDKKQGWETQAFIAKAGLV